LRTQIWNPARGKGVILIEKYLIQSGHEEKARDDDEQGEKE
jgi:hypothetical protein